MLKSDAAELGVEAVGGLVPGPAAELPRVASARKVSSVSPPPPVLNGCRVLKFAAIARPVVYSGRTGLIVIPPSGKSKEIGRVPRLAIAETLRGDRECLIFHCTRTWRVLGIQGGYATRKAAEARAERIYRGVSNAWIELRTSRREAKRIDAASWAPFRCSFCERIPPDFKPEKSGLIAAKKAAICRECVSEFHRSFERP